MVDLLDRKNIRPTATWYDDEPDKVKRYQLALETASNHHIEIQAPYALSEIHDVTDLNFVDLDLRRLQFSGVQLARKLVSINHKARIVFVSRYLASARFEKVDRQLAPTTPVAFLEKTDLADASLFADNSTDNLIIEQGVKAVKEAVSEVERDGHVLEAPPSVLGDELAGVTAEAFYSRPKLEQANTVLEARAKLGQYLRSMFAAHTEVSWIVIGVPSAEVIKWGMQGDPEPTDKATMIKDARDSLNPLAVPMLFHRPRYRH